jgi:hypothetical protein
MERVRLKKKRHFNHSKEAEGPGLRTGRFRFIHGIERAASKRGPYAGGPRC